MRFFEKGFWCGLIERAMPDSLTMAVTTGLGFSVIAGIVSGVCYVLTYGLPRARGRKPQTPWHCAVCGCQFRSIDGILEADSVAKCARCGRRVCRERCSKRAAGKEDGGWLCTRCEPDTWIAGLLSALQTKSNRDWYSTKTMNRATPEEVDEDLLELQRREREQVRDFIERLVGALLGGDLDNVSVKKLYNDSKYDAIYARYHGEISNALTDLGSALHISIASKWYLPIAGQSPCSAHATLKLLIQRFIQEAHELPKLRKFDCEDAGSADRTYEDLLATAIINKVVQNCQDGGPSRSASRTSSKKSDKEYFFGARNLEDTSSLSSMDDYSDTMSLKVPRRIKEESSSDDARDEDEDWQDNWKLQRKKFDGTHSPVPVPMLVPDPITEAKVLIGDREADDTTDLSDAASDYEEAEEIEPTTLNAVLVNSRTVIGGKNPLLAKEAIEEDGSTDDEELKDEREDIVKQLNSLEADDESIIETKNHILIEEEEEDKGVDETSFMSLDSNTEKDLEYTEKYASLPRTIYKSSKPAPRNSTLTVPERNSTPNSDLTTDNVDSGVTSDEDEKQRVFKGTYSEREKEKWNHAVPLANNPYSKSNLERRLSSSRSSNSSLSPTSESSESAMADGQGKKSLFDMLDEDRKKGNHVFDRDYYIREAAKSAGARKATSPTASPPSIPLVDEEVIFKAVPALVQDDDSSIEPPTPTRPNHLDLSSDSDYSLERSYNPQTGEIRKQQNRTDLIKAASSPEGHLDENHNDKLKRDFLKSLTEEETSTSSFDSVNPPAVNHFRLVDEIAKETPEQYVEVPISPPPAYKTDVCHDRLKSPELIKMIKEIDQIDSVAPATPPSSPKDFSLTYSEPEETVNIINKELTAFDESNEKNSNENLMSEADPDDIVLEPASVKKLSKIFDQSKNGKQDVYSLTARSIPKQFRRELSKEHSLSQENIKDVIRAVSPTEEVVLPFPKAKSKIDFFEKLKN